MIITRRASRPGAHVVVSCAALVSFQSEPVLSLETTVSAAAVLVLTSANARPPGRDPALKPGRPDNSPRHRKNMPGLFTEPADMDAMLNAFILTGLEYRFGVYASLLERQCAADDRRRNSAHCISMRAHPLASATRRTADAQEYQAIAAGLADSTAAATGQVVFTDWVAARGTMFGRHYASEVNRHSVWSLDRGHDAG